MVKILEIKYIPTYATKFWIFMYHSFSYMERHATWSPRLRGGTSVSNAIGLFSSGLS